MNWKRGIRRCMWLVSALAGLIGFSGMAFGFWGFPEYGIEDWPWAVAFGAVPFFVTPWIIYWIILWGAIPIIRWIVRGFGDGEFGEQVKNNSPQKMSPAAKQLLFDIIKWTIIIIIAAIVYIVVQHILAPPPERLF